MENFGLEDLLICLVRQWREKHKREDLVMYRGPAINARLMSLVIRDFEMKHTLARGHRFAMGFLLVAESSLQL